ncbi:hypothetical protein QL919_03905 [Psychrobacter sp. APC 3426]|uniref:hypothetical protein n=1 Tax=Psychrobacter sp. APC 3426 TaxID=3035177 RepID=UPI0025B5BEA2|nr:hypothetical protein [Psychrobacter sp. APC 3426]MDN3397869.1 hypothetical protein [Psychrobacter sp. APC 3426]
MSDLKAHQLIYAFFFLLNYCIFTFTKLGDESMNKVILILASLLISSATYAECTELLSGKRCTDEYGNQYTIQNTLSGGTEVRGYNPRTGSRWSQSTRKSLGGDIIQEGVDADGRRWNQTIHKDLGGRTVISGVDSDGNRYRKVID